MVEDAFFMWSFEKHLQHALEGEARALFEGIDPTHTLVPRVRLVGVLDGDRSGQIPACVVPEDECFKYAAFAGVKDLAKRLEQSDQAREASGGDRGVGSERAATV